MSELIGSGATVGLPAEIAARVLDLPGVIRLEPTLASSGLRTLRLRGGMDGITLTRRGDLVEAEIDVAIAGPGSAREIAATVRAQVIEVITGRGLLAGPAVVNVLRIDPLIG